MTQFRKLFMRISAMAITMFAVFVFSTTASAATYPIRGDVDNDGRVDVFDLVRMRQYYAGNNKSSIDFQNVDIDRNGKFNDADFDAFRDILFGTDSTYFIVKGKNKEFKENTKFLDNGKYFGIVQGDGNVVIYRRDGNKDVAVFNTGTHVNASSYKNHRLAFQVDGNIVLYATRKSDGKTVARWNTQTHLGQGDMYMAFLNTKGELEWTTLDRMVWTTGSNYLANERNKALKRVQSGYVYSSHLNAAMDFIFAYGKQSVSENREYGATIERLGEGRYQLYWKDLCGPYRKPGSYDGTGPTLYFGGDTVAYVHTHGKEVGWENNRFSDGDIDIAYDCSVVAYVGAPNGEVRVFDPAKDERKARFQSGRVIYTKAPH